ncbi:MAG: C40 family peptidase [Vicinamibacterales bacterium]
MGIVVDPRRLVAVLLVCGTAACAGRVAPRPYPGAAGPDGGVARTVREREAIARGDRVAAAALDLRGVPYRNGGNDPGGFDCSGLVAYVFGREGIAMPRQTVAQYEVGHAVKPAEVRAGDLLFFATVSNGPSHVAIALDADTFVHAPSSRGVVRVERLALPYWSSRFLGARRIVD